MFPYFRERLTLLLIGLLPFHAFLVTVLTKWIEGPGHAPLGYLAVWKEALLGLILLIALIEWLRKMLRGTGFSLFIDRLSPDVVDVLICVLLVLGIVVSTINHQSSTINFFYGFKYDFIPLIAFLVLRRVEWSDAFKTRMMRLLVIIGGIVAAYGIFTFFVPPAFFHWLGYSDLHSLYLADAPLAAYQQIGGTALRRIQSVMSGPNQLGIWLLVPMSMVLKRVILSSTKGDTRLMSWFVGLTMTLALFLTFSRSAWIAAFVITLVALWTRLPRGKTRQVAFGSIAAACVTVGVVLAVLFPQVVVRVSSSRGHIEKPFEAIQTMVRHPLGLGLGAAGPASNRVSDTCVELNEGDDPSWAADRPDLCVFVGDTQVQPVDRACDCPFLPENWYLQMGVEMGFLGMGIFILLVLVMLKKLQTVHGFSFFVFSSEEDQPKTKNEKPTNFLFLAFLGVSVAALFLHAWEDGAVAYTLWLLAAVALTKEERLS